MLDEERGGQRETPLFANVGPASLVRAGRGSVSLLGNCVAFLIAAATRSEGRTWKNFTWAPDILDFSTPFARPRHRATVGKR